MFHEKELLETLKRMLVVLERIDRKLPERYSIRITQEKSMSIGNLSTPGTASLLLALLDNGLPYVAPAGSAYVFTPILTASDPSVTIAADPTVPEQFDVTIPAGDTNTSVTFTGSATAPDGTTATGPLSIPMTPTPQQFSISVTQVS